MSAHLVVLAVAAVTILALVSDSQSSRSDSGYKKSVEFVEAGRRAVVKRECPHPAFTSKHMLLHNLDRRSHAEYASDERNNIRNRINSSPTEIQSLFYRPGMTYKIEGDYCIFTKSATKWDCRKDETLFAGWGCENRGKIIAKHSIVNGHYYPKKDKIAK